MTNFIKLDINEHLQTKYPNLPSDQIDLIASDVSRRWDYGLLIDSVDHKVRETASYANIKLRSQFNTESVADISDNEADVFDEVSKPEPMEHTSEGC